MEARYAIGNSALFFVGGLVAVLVNAGLYLWGPHYYPIVALAGLLAVLVGLRGLDRRIKLRIGPEGFWYAPWGHQPIPWGEFERYSTFLSGKFQFIELHPKYPEQLRTRLPLISRVNSRLNARFGKPSFYINPTQFDVGADVLASALGHHLRSAV
jgi:hypothetical protein